VCVSVLSIVRLLAPYRLLDLRSSHPFLPCSNFCRRLAMRPRYLTSVASLTIALAFVHIRIFKFSFTEIARDPAVRHHCYGSGTNYQWTVKSR
jgi:hypothetical protein